MCAAAAAAAARAGKSPSWARRARVTRQQQQRHSYLRTPLPPPIHMLSGQTDRQTDGQHVRTYHSVRSVHSIRLIAVCMCVCAHMRTSRPPNRSRAPVSRPALRSTEGASFFLWCLVEGGIGLDWTGSRGESAHCRLARQGGAWQSPRCCCCCCCWCCIVAAYLVGSLQGLDPETTSAAVRAAAAPASGLPPELAQGGRGSERA